MNGNEKTSVSEHSQATHNPLPEEIQQMSRDETVCKFCGISYLIHNEIKQLESSLASLNAQLSACQSAENELKALQIETNEHHRTIKELQLAKDDLDQKNVKLKSRLSELSCDNDDLRVKLSGEKLESDQRLADLNRISNQFKVLRTTLPEIFSKIRDQRAAMNATSFREELARERVELSNHIQSKLLQLKAATLNVVNSEKIEKSREAMRLATEQQVEIEHYKREALQNANEIDRLQTELKRIKTESLETAQRLEYETNQIQIQANQAALEWAKRVDELDISLKAEKSKNAELHDRANSITTEKAREFGQLRETLNQKCESMRLITTKVSEIEEESKFKDAKIAQLQEELEKQREATNIKAKDQENEFHHKYVELKVERDKMILAHNNRIEQLQQSYQQQLEKAMAESNKLQSESKINKKSLNDELDTLKRSLQENHELELQIAKQRQDELANQIRTEMHTKLRDKDEEIAKLQIAYSIKENADNENIHREKDQQISELELVINNFKDELDKLHLNYEVKMRQLNQQNEQHEMKLTDQNTIMDRMEADLVERLQEIDSLKKTVHNECEERIQLSEALDNAREQLMSLKLKNESAFQKNLVSKAITSPKSAWIQSNIVNDSNLETMRNGEEKLLTTRRSSVGLTTPHKQLPPIPPKSSSAKSETTISISRPNSSSQLSIRANEVVSNANSHDPSRPNMNSSDTLQLYKSMTQKRAIQKSHQTFNDNQNSILNTKRKLSSLLALAEKRT